MKRYAIPVVLIMLLISSAAWAQVTKAGVIGTKHDIGGLGCKSCHAAHDGSASPFDLPAGGNAKSGSVLLWDRNFTQTTQFGTYTSPTLTSPPTELSTGVAGQIPAATDPRQNSLLCMSCHDGLTSTTVMPATDVYAVGSTTSLGLTNDHPVNMAYNDTLNKSLKAATAVTSQTVLTATDGGLTLPGNTVQCSSCHTSHDNSKGHFLRKLNTGSGLCLTCHR